MKCVLVLCVAFAASAYGYPQRLSFYPVPREFANVYGDYPFEQPRRNRDLGQEESTSDDTTGVFNPSFDRPEFHDPADYEPYYSSSSHFSDLMTQMREMMIRLKQEMNEVLRRIPATSDESDSGSSGGIFSFGSSELDLGDAQNKTTSKTEVIDGQVYVVNETVVRSGDESGGSIFRVKTIQIKPSETPEIDSIEPDETTPKVVDSNESVPEVTELTKLKNNDNNEIPNETKIRSTEWDSPETVDSAPSAHLNEIDNSLDIETFETPDSFKPIDLSQDILVNKYMSDHEIAQGLVLVNPAVELIDVNNVKPNDYYRYDNLKYEPMAPLERIREEIEEMP